MNLIDQTQITLWKAQNDLNKCISQELDLLKKLFDVQAQEIAALQLKVNTFINNNNVSQ